MKRKPQRCSRKKSGKNWRDFGQRSMIPMPAEYLKVRITGKKPKYPKAPLEDEFAAWLRKHLALKYGQKASEITIERHLQVLRGDIARKGIIGYLTSFESERNKRVTQRYYKEFLCEHFSHIILHLLQDAEREREIRKEKE